MENVNYKRNDIVMVVMSLTGASNGAIGELFKVVGKTAYGSYELFSKEHGTMFARDKHLTLYGKP